MAKEIRQRNLNDPKAQESLERAKKRKQEAKERLKETWNNPAGVFDRRKNWKDEDTEEPNAPEQPDPERDELKRLITDPAALDSLNDEQLERLRITTESRLERCEREFSREERELLAGQNDLSDLEPEFRLNPVEKAIAKATYPEEKVKARANIARQKQEQIDNLKLLLKFIAHRQKANQESSAKPKPTQPPLTKAEQRERLLTEIQTLQKEKASALEKLRNSSAGEVEIRRYENMYDNAIQRLETQLESLLIK